MSRQEEQRQFNNGENRRPRDFHVPDLEPPVKKYDYDRGGRAGGAGNQNPESSRKYFSRDDSGDDNRRNVRRPGRSPEEYMNRSVPTGSDAPRRARSNEAFDYERRRQINTSPVRRENEKRQSAQPYDFSNFESGPRPQRDRRPQPGTAPQQRKKRSNAAQNAPRATSGREYANREEMRKHQNLRRKKAIKRRRIFMAGVLGIIALITAVSLSLTVFFKINKIEISGTQMYTQEQVLASISFKTNDNLFMIKASKDEEAIPSRLPYIKSAEIKRSLPGTVKINLTENSAKYFYQYDEHTSYLFDENLKVLEKKTDYQNEGFIVLEEVSFKTIDVASKPVFSDEKTQKRIEALAQAIKDNNMEGVTSLKSLNESTNYIIYDGRITVKLGALTNIKYKMELAKSSISDLNESSPGAKGTLDVTVDKKAYFTADEN